MSDRHGYMTPNKNERYQAVLHYFSWAIIFYFIIVLENITLLHTNSFYIITLVRERSSSTPFYAFKLTMTMPWSSDHCYTGHMTSVEEPTYPGDFQRHNGLDPPLLLCKCHNYLIYQGSAAMNISVSKENGSFGLFYRWVIVLSSGRLKPDVGY